MQRNKVLQNNNLTKKFTHRFIKNTGLMSLIFAMSMQANASNISTNLPVLSPNNIMTNSTVTEGLIASGIKDAAAAIYSGGQQIFNLSGKIAKKYLPTIGIFISMHPYLSMMAVSLPATAYFLKKKYDQHKWSKIEEHFNEQLKENKNAKNLNIFLDPNTKISIDITNTEDQVTFTTATPIGFLKTMIKNSVELVKFVKASNGKDLPRFLQETQETSKEEDQKAQKKTIINIKNQNPTQANQNMNNPQTQYATDSQTGVTIDIAQLNLLLANLTMKNGKIKDVGALAKTIESIINQGRVNYGNFLQSPNRDNLGKVLYTILNQYFIETTPTSYTAKFGHMTKQVLPLILNIVKSADEQGLLSNNIAAEKRILEVLRNSSKRQ